MQRDFLSPLSESKWMVMYWSVSYLSWPNSSHWESLALQNWKCEELSVATISQTVWLCLLKIQYFIWPLLFYIYRQLEKKIVLGSYLSWISCLKISMAKFSVSIYRHSKIDWYRQNETDKYRQIQIDIDKLKEK